MDQTKSLAQVEDEIGFDGPSEGGYKSGLIHRCETLYSKPLREYSPGDLRVMIGQNIALQYLIPLALDVLSRDPLVKGDYYQGDLLGAVLGCGRRRPYARFWEDNPSLKSRLREVVQRLHVVPYAIEERVQQFRASSDCMAAVSAQTRRRRGRKRKA